MSPKRIMNVDLSHLPKCTEIRTCFTFKAKQVLISRGLTGKF